MDESKLLIHQAQAYLSLCAITAFAFLPHSANAGTASVSSLQAGPTPFIELVTANYGGGALQSVSYSIQPNAGSSTRPFSVTYPASYFATTGPINSSSVTFSVFGLYAGTTNTVNLSFAFTDSTVVTQSISITTPTYSDPCTALNTPTLTQYRTSTNQLSFDYFLIKDTCSSNGPAIVDTDGNFRWVGTANVGTPSSILYNNGIYTASGTGIKRSNSPPER